MNNYEGLNEVRRIGSEMALSAKLSLLTSTEPILRASMDEIIDLLGIQKVILDELIEPYERMPDLEPGRKEELP